MCHVVDTLCHGGGGGGVQLAAAVASALVVDSHDETLGHHTILVHAE